MGSKMEQGRKEYLMRRGNRIAEEGYWCGQSEKETAEIKGSMGK